jgi:hypothetical protein
MAGEASAYAGLNFLSELAGGIYAFPGGNAAIARAMAQIRSLPKRFGNVLLAHSEGQGMPAVESAILEGMSAAAIIRGG